MISMSAINAYRQQLKMQQGMGMQEADAEPTGGAAFAKLLENATQNGIDQQYQTEATTMDSLTTNKVDLTDLVTAISSAELTLNTVVAVRDRIINAYQDIIRMPI